MTDPTPPAALDPSTAAADRRYTGIIYFHGMGTPRRFEELTRVLDTMDRYATSQKTDDQLVTDRTVGFEPSRCDASEPVAFIRFHKTTPSSTPSAPPDITGQFRLYESYWSPAAAGADTPISVVLWVLARMPTPFRVLLQPWRVHKRLKHTFLSRMFFDRTSMSTKRYETLARLYENFDGLNARRIHPSGRFGRFLKFVSDTQRDPKARTDLQWLAGEWFSTLFRTQMSVLGTALNCLAVLIGVSSMAAYLVGVLLELFGLETGLTGTLVARGGDLPAWLNILAIVVFAAMGWSTARFLQLFLSDVVFWTTTFEKDVRYRKRKDILRAAEDTVAHVLRDPDCERVVVVAHSLGTAIAYETLLNLGRKLSAQRQDRAAGPSGWENLRKISHLLTFGSPIDRINYFFQLGDRGSYRFNRFSDELLGHCFDLPFRDGDQQILWINVRDPADPVASRLFSPRGSRLETELILEVESACGHFPEPAQAHTRYFDTHVAGKLLFDACILGRRSVQLQLERPDWSGRFARRLKAFFALLVPLLCLGMAVSGVAYWANWTDALLKAQVFILVVVSAILLLVALGAAADRKHSLVLPP